jgi:hypothetical protein
LQLYVLISSILKPRRKDCSELNDYALSELVSEQISTINKKVKQSRYTPWRRLRGEEV